jgi:hypothetical protein
MAVVNGSHVGLTPIFISSALPKMLQRLDEYVIIHEADMDRYSVDVSLVIAPALCSVLARLCIVIRGSYIYPHPEESFNSTIRESTLQTIARMNGLADLL